jgi:hypothetical protein
MRLCAKPPNSGLEKMEQMSPFNWKERRAGIKGLGQQTKTSPLPCSTGEIKRAVLALAFFNNKAGDERGANPQIQLRQPWKGATERSLFAGEISFTLRPPSSLSLFRSSISIFQFSPCSSVRPPASRSSCRACEFNFTQRQLFASFSLCVTRRRHLLGAKRITLQM